MYINEKPASDNVSRRRSIPWFVSSHANRACSHSKSWVEVLWPSRILEEGLDKGRQAVLLPISGLYKTVYHRSEAIPTKDIVPPVTFLSGYFRERIYFRN